MEVKVAPNKGMKYRKQGLKVSHDYLYYLKMSDYRRKRKEFCINWYKNRFYDPNWRD